jgi:transcriptional regulator with XRE-family HTH domain
MRWGFASSERAGWSQRSLAGRAGVDPKTVNLIERGERSPTLFTMKLLADALGVCLSEVLSRIEPSAKKK